MIRLCKRTDGTYVLSCLRADGSVTWQKNRGGHAAFFPVHDLTHYAVESVLGHRRGFFRLLAGGWDFADFNEDWGKRPMPEDAEPSELIVGLLDGDRYGVGGTPTTAADLNASARRYFEQHGCPGSAADIVRVTDDDLSRIRARLVELTARWNRLPRGETLELPFDVR